MTCGIPFFLWLRPLWRVNALMNEPDSSGDIATPTFGDALASADQSAAASPAPHTETSAPSVPATTQQGEVPGSPASQGPIPYDRHEAVLAAERRKREDVESRYAWAQSVNPDQYAAMAQWFQRAAADPVAFLQQFRSELEAHPQFRSKLQAIQQPTSTGEPQPDLIAENGEQVYSAKQQRAWAEWQRTQLMAEIQQQISPLMEDRQVQQVRSMAEQRVQSQLQEAQTWEAFGDLRSQIAQIMTRDGRATLSSAYHRAHSEWAKSRDQRVREQVLAELRDKSTASSVNPSRSGGSQPKDYRKLGFGEALRDSMAEATR